MNCDYINELKQSIENMRGELNNEISHSSTIKNDEVMKLSLQLDKLISEYFKLTA